MQENRANLPLNSVAPADHRATNEQMPIKRGRGGGDTNQRKGKNSGSNYLFPIRFRREEAAARLRETPEGGGEVRSFFWDYG